MLSAYFQRSGCAIGVWALFALGAGCGGSPPSPPADPAPADAMTGSADATCSPATCSGCCFNNICQTGTSITGCGKGGERCSVCDSAAYEICLPQQTCDLDPNGLWRLLLTAAKIRSTDGTGGWDGTSGSLPDPYFRMGSFKSQTKADTLSPTWSDQGANFKASDLTSLGVYLEIWDEDATSSDDVVAPRSLFRFQTANLAAGEATISGWGQTTSVTLRFVKLP